MSAALATPSVADAITGGLHVMGPPLDDPPLAPLDDPPLDDPPDDPDDPPLDDPPDDPDDPPLDDPPDDPDDPPLDDSAGAGSDVPEVGVPLSELQAVREHTTAVAANAAMKKRMNRLLTR